MYRRIAFLSAVIVWMTPGSILGWEESDISIRLRDEPISVAQLPMDLDSSTEERDEPGPLAPGVLAATEDEVKQFLADYVERYTQKNLEGLLALFSRRAIQNERDEIDEIERMYTSLFRKSRDLQYDVEPTRIEIYQNGVDARARYQVDQILKRSGREKVWKGEIRWILVKENGALRIRYQDDWVERSSLRENVADLRGRPDAAGSSRGRGEGGQSGGGGTSGGTSGGSGPGGGDSGDGGGEGNGGGDAPGGGDSGGGGSDGGEGDADSGKGKGGGSGKSKGKGRGHDGKGKPGGRSRGGDGDND